MRASTTLLPMSGLPSGTWTSVRNDDSWYLAVRLEVAVRGFRKRIGTRTM